MFLPRPFVHTSLRLAALVFHVFIVVIKGVDDCVVREVFHKLRLNVMCVVIKGNIIIPITVNCSYQERPGCIYVQYSVPVFLSESAAKQNTLFSLSSSGMSCSGIDTTKLISISSSSFSTCSL